MKNLSIFVFWILLFNEGFSQSCLPEGIIFTSQAQIDNFKTNYPDCTEIEGDVLISGDNITHFYGLNELASIDGNLNIQDNDNLGGMWGFEALHHVHGSISIKNNKKLQTLSGLESLFYIRGSLRISNNEALISLKGPVNMNSIGGDLFIDSNLVLFNMHSLYGITSIGGYGGSGTGSINIRSNASLTSLNSLGNVHSYSIGEVHIYSNPLLSDCDVASICAFLSEPGGIIDVHDNAEGCNSEEEVVEDCSDNCFPGGLQIFDQGQIDSILIKYPDCKEIMGRIWMDDLNNENILNLNGFRNINSIDGYLVIGHSPKLKSLHGLDSLVTLGGSLYLDSNDSLENLLNLSRLECLLGSIHLDNNSLIINLSGLENLYYIGYDVIMQYNATLHDLSGLQNVTSIGSMLAIWDNPSLTSLTGLDNIESNTISSLNIHDNPLLSECEVNSICYYLLTPGKSAFIENNASGCNNKEEIIDKCDVNIPANPPFGNPVSFYPNPVTTNITVDIAFPGVELCLYNLAGQALILKTIKHSKERIDLSHLPAGVYFVRFTGDSFITILKLIKY